MLPTSQERRRADHYQVRTWRAWYAHITLSMLALAWLAGTKASPQKGIGVQTRT
jgi:SRSO17 transposase